jgi:hypothetical protein
MDDAGLPPLKKVLEQERSNGMLETSPDEAVFEQAVSHGMFHADDADWPAIAGTLNRKQLASLYPAICHALVRGGPGYSLELLACYHYLEQWQNDGKLPEGIDLADKLAGVRKAVFQQATDEPGIWWAEMATLMKILEYGVAMREERGVVELMGAYESFGYDFDDAVKSRRRK